MANSKRSYIHYHQLSNSNWFYYVSFLVIEYLLGCHKTFCLRPEGENLIILSRSPFSGSLKHRAVLIPSRQIQNTFMLILSWKLHVLGGQTIRKKSDGSWPLHNGCLRDTQSGYTCFLDFKSVFIGDMSKRSVYLPFRKMSVFQMQMSMIS